MVDAVQTYLEFARDIVPWGLHHDALKKHSKSTERADVGIIGEYWRRICLGTEFEYYSDFNVHAIQFPNEDTYPMHLMKGLFLFPRQSR